MNRRNQHRIARGLLVCALVAYLVGSGEAAAAFGLIGAVLEVSGWLLWLNADLKEEENPKAGRQQEK